MPLELGIFIGAHHFAPLERYNHSEKFVVMDTKPYRYQMFISDINGQDIKAHFGKAEKVIQNVRDFLAVSSKRKLPGSSYLADHYSSFQKTLPEICQPLQWKVAELTFIDYVNCVTIWIANTLP